MTKPLSLRPGTLANRQLKIYRSSSLYQGMKVNMRDIPKFNVFCAAAKPSTFKPFGFVECRSVERNLSFGHLIS
jgi:hypothetical protein